MENSESLNHNTKFIYLDFNGKISSDVFHNQVFLRISNLHEKNPLVQVNDNLFKGTYELSMGTNLFFEEADNTHTSTAFDKARPICMKYFQSSTKVLNLQQVKIPQAKANFQNEINNINYNLRRDYTELLQKLENGTLKIEDISSDELPPERSETEQEKIENNESQSNVTIEVETELELDKQVENALEDITPLKILEAEYEQLKLLARKPVNRAASPELTVQCDEKYEKAFEYHNIERQILKPRVSFKEEVLHVDENTLCECVDIDRCVLYGLIPASSVFPRLLSKEEKEKLLTIENFENLSLGGRYYVLQDLVSNLEEYVKNASPTDLKSADEYGRTPVETLEIYKKLCEAVKNRLQEIKFSLENVMSCENKDK